MQKRLFNRLPIGRIFKKGGDAYASIKDFADSQQTIRERTKALLNNTNNGISPREKYPLYFASEVWALQGC